MAAEPANQAAPGASRCFPPAAPASADVPEEPVGHKGASTAQFASSRPTEQRGGEHWMTGVASDLESGATPPFTSQVGSPLCAVIFGGGRPPPKDVNGLVHRLYVRFCRL